MNLVLLGLPGAGKGTQAKMMTEEFEIPHIATGDIFRSAIRNQTELGKKAKQYIDAGELVPDEVTIGIVRERLQEDDCQQGFILDGFPRTLDQAEALSEILADEGESIDMALYIEVPEQELVRRISGRRICEECGASYHVEFNPPEQKGVCDKCGGNLIQRSDDKPETVKNRIKVNKEQMQELLDYYGDKGVLTAVDGEGDVSVIFDRITRVIREQG
ncbi:MAG: adenylate kinase [Bacillota bacterium]